MLPDHWGRPLGETEKWNREGKGESWKTVKLAGWNSQQEQSTLQKLVEGPTSDISFVITVAILCVC